MFLQLVELGLEESLESLPLVPVDQVDGEVEEGELVLEGAEGVCAGFFDGSVCFCLLFVEWVGVGFEEGAEEARGGGLGFLESKERLLVLVDGFDGRCVAFERVAEDARRPVAKEGPRQGGGGGLGEEGSERCKDRVDYLDCCCRIGVRVGRGCGSCRVGCGG